MAKKSYSGYDLGSNTRVGSSLDPVSSGDLATLNYLQTNYALLVENVYTVTTSGTAQTLADVSVGTILYITLTNNCTLTFPTAVAGKSFLLYLKQDGTGSRTVTWPSSSIVKWQGGTQPTLTTTAGKTDGFAFVCVDGTAWLASTAGLNW